MAQRGVFSWKWLNGYNVWDRDFYDKYWGKPVHRAIVPLPDPEHANRFVGFSHDMVWVNQHGELLAETRTIRIGRVHEDGEQSAYSIDWHSTSTPLVPELVLERKPEWGLCWLAYALSALYFQKFKIAAATQPITEDHQELAEWLDYRFWLDGIESRTHFENWAGLTMMSHPPTLVIPAHLLGTTSKIFIRCARHYCVMNR